MNLTIFTKLFLEYSKLIKNFTDPILKIGEKFAFYEGDSKNLADDNEIGILTHNVIEIDVKSAFPTICNILFGPESKFITKLNSIEDKLEKNIYMTNYLVKLGHSKDHNYLVDLNNYTKLVIFSKIYNEYDNVIIFEYKKDSLLFSGSKVKDKSEIITNVFSENNFKFHENIYKIYIRFNRTSLYLTKNNELIIKGKWKDPPIFITETILNMLLGKRINEENIIVNYSNISYQLIKNTDEYEKYYKFGSKFYTNTEILKDFLIPLIYMIKNYM